MILMEFPLVATVHQPCSGLGRGGCSASKMFASKGPEPHGHPMTPCSCSGPRTTAWCTPSAQCVACSPHEAQTNSSSPQAQHALSIDILFFLFCCCSTRGVSTANCDCNSGKHEAGGFGAAHCDMAHATRHAHNAVHKNTSEGWMQGAATTYPARCTTSPFGTRPTRPV